MKNYIRIIAFILAMLTIAGFAVACAEVEVPEETTEGTAETVAPGEEVTTADSSKDENGYLKDDLPETLDLKEKLVLFMWEDYTMREFYADETGDTIDDAIYKRNIAVQTRLNVEIEYVEEQGASGDYPAWVKKAETDFNSDNYYDLYAGYSRSAPEMAMKGMCTNLLETEYFDVEKPWWPKALTEECVINDKLYFCTGDISTNMLWMMTATYYNKDMFESRYAGQKTPMDLVESNEWTLDAFIGMAKDLYTDNGDGTKNEEDTFGYALYETNLDAFQTAAGVVSVVKNADGELQISDDFKSERLQKVCELIGAFIKTDDCIHSSSTGIREVFFAQRALFMTDRLFVIAGKDSQETNRIEFDYGIVPQPKYETSQETFMTNVGHPFSMYAINSQSKKLVACSAWMEAMGSQSYRSVTPAVFEVAMKVRYNDDPQATQMFDILKDNVSFDLGRLYASTFVNHTANLFRLTTLSDNPSGYLSQVRKYAAVLDKGITKLVESFED